MVPRRARHVGAPPRSARRRIRRASGSSARAVRVAAGKFQKIGDAAEDGTEDAAEDDASDAASGRPSSRSSAAPTMTAPRSSTTTSSPTTSSTPSPRRDRHGAGHLQRFSRQPRRAAHPRALGSHLLRQRYGRGGRPAQGVGDHPRVRLAALSARRSRPSASRRSSPTGCAAMLKARWPDAPLPDRILQRP